VKFILNIVELAVSITVLVVNRVHISNIAVWPCFYASLNIFYILHILHGVL
jgi:hypothetical protein